ncbi:retrovirus-related Pol polyprotein from transposon 17.6 [Trichonephila clavipes]|nr:retrovirus-related Pol polyprotein from transposon 17.6 [Trichonephila clavipes]
MRIAFDASSHEEGQPSLNDCIWSGENLNPNIFHLIISFRLNTIAITADIERAFLQISLRDEDRDAVRFLFPDIRSNQTDPYKFQVYRFKRVMFGVNVTFLLSATIKHQIENYREQYPAATEMLDTCLYVDDVISGADNISQALKVSKDAETIMKNASMKLRKWNSNDQTLMRTWEKEGLETHPRHPDDSSKIPSSKVLGIPWDVVHDYFTIDVKGLLQLDTSKPITKRIVLQSAGKIYDPVGFLSPYTIRLKCLLQELWLRKLSWDDELPPDIHAVWSQWWLELPFLSELKIPRKILDSSGDSSEVQIHTFSDASQKAYGAAAFLRVKHKDRVSVDLVTSKSRIRSVQPEPFSGRTLRSPYIGSKVQAIDGNPFVANRVREIQSLTDPNSWFHCSGKDNPADLITRGISVDALTTNSKWWNGSSFLRQIDFQTKGLDEAIPERVYLTEMRKNSKPKEDISLTLTVTKNNFLENIIDISNNYVKLIRVEVSHAENWLIHSLHEREFYEEMRKLLADISRITTPFVVKIRAIDLTHTDLAEHDIELEYERAIVAKPHRMSPRQIEILKSEVNKMLELKIIEPGESDFTSPLILVEAPGKEARPCIDYKRLNIVTRKQFFPLPNIEELLEKVSAAKYISILDLTRGYWQISLSPRAQRYAAFVTTFGTFKPLRLPFGQKNASYYFSRLTTNLLRNCEDYAVPYLDDVAIFSLAWRDHLKHLKDVFDHLRSTKLHIKPSKCQFSQAYVKYLGHLVSQSLRTPGELKVQVIKDFPIPSNETQVRAFLGLSGCYRRYIPEFSVIAAPLTDLLKGRNRKSTVDWNSSCQNAFEELKTRLSKNPVLYSPDFPKPFIIQCDASNLGIGVVLSQVCENEEHPIMFLSKKLSLAEQKYSTTEKECAAIIFAVQKLKSYLDGHQKFVIQTDHNTLVWLEKNTGTNPRLLRWALILQSFNYENAYRKGKQNQNADSLSHIP